MRWVLYPIAVIFSLALIAVAGVAALTAFSWPNLPSVDILTDYHPKIPLRIFTADGHLLAEYRIPAGTGSHELQLGHLPSGTYFLRATQKDHTEVLRVVKR